MGKKKPDHVNTETHTPVSRSPGKVKKKKELETNKVKKRSPPKKPKFKSPKKNKKAEDYIDE